MFSNFVLCPLMYRNARARVRACVCVCLCVCVPACVRASVRVSIFNCLKVNAFGHGDSALQ